MWFIYISIAVLYRGTFCNPVIKVAEQSNCTVVITRFGEQVTTLEVKWKSTITLICNASCVGPGPQPGLTWFYRDKSNQNKLIRIERLFQSEKFATYAKNFHRRNELVIRDFGPNEETDFICNGFAKRHRVEAKVALIGTDCLLKYNFRCKLDNKCIDRAYLCNQNNECSDGEDEIGCDNNMNPTTTVATTQMPETSVGTEGTSDENDYNDFAKTVSTILMTQTDMKTEQISKQIVTATPPVVCTADQYKCANGECVDGRYRCDGQYDCSDGSDEENCPTAVCLSDELRCMDQRKCVSIASRCNGIPDCEDGSDETECELRPICTEGRKLCNDFSKCIDDSQLCNRIPDCTDGSDEKDCDLNNEPQTSRASQQKDDGKYDVTEEKTKILMVNVEINVDGDNGLPPTTDGVIDNTGEYTDTTPFEYELYAN